MIINNLPGEGKNYIWFKRLNKFEKQETLRQIQFKRKHWPDIKDGCWSKRPAYTYPHIMPVGNLKKVFYEPIANPVIEYCEDNDIAIHSEALNLRSSQVCCFNVMFPFKLDHLLGVKCLGRLLPDAVEIEDIQFEYTGPDGITEWLGEPMGGKRGQNRTSIDAAIWWKDRNGNKNVTLVEWKYTEKSFGSCGGYESGGNKNKNWCKEFDLSLRNKENKCYLAYSNNHRKYWEHLKEAGINIDKLADIKGCPFKGPFCQLMRQYFKTARRCEQCVSCVSWLQR